MPLFSQTKGSYDFTLHSSNSYSSYMEFTLKERLTQTTVSFGFGIPGVFEFGYNFNNAKYSKSVKKLRRVSGKVRLLPGPQRCSRGPKVLSQSSSASPRSPTAS